MDKARRTRTRPPDAPRRAHPGEGRPPDTYLGPGPVDRPRCSRCAAWVEVRYVHGTLTSVMLVHRWHCGTRRQPMDLADWGGGTRQG